MTDDLQFTMTIEPSPTTDERDAIAAVMVLHLNQASIFVDEAPAYPQENWSLAGRLRAHANRQPGQSRLPDWSKSR